MKEQAKHYGKYALTGAVGIGLGFTAFTVNDTPTKQTDTYQNLQDKLDTAQNNADDFESQVADLETTVTDKEERVSNLESQVTQFNQTVEELRAENADLEDAVATAQERVGLVDYLPVFSDEDVEFEGDSIGVTVDEEVTDGEGDYDQIDAEYVSDDGEYDVTITEYEESEDADEAVQDFHEEQTPIEFSTSGDEHTVSVTVDERSAGSITGDGIVVEYGDDVVEDVDHKDDVESVVVDGEDITDKVDEVKRTGDDSEVEIVFDDSYNLNDGDVVEVVYSDAEETDSLEKVYINDYSNAYEYDTDDDVEEDIYRDGDTVVKVTGTDNGDEFEAQYEDLTSQYE